VGGRGGSRRRPAPALAAAARAAVSSLPRVNDIATGIAVMLFGTGLAFYLGKPLDPAAGAAACPALPLGALERLAGGRALRCRSTSLFPLGMVLALLMTWGLRTHALGPARAHGGRLQPTRRARWAPRSIRVRIAATTAGGFVAGLGGASPVAVLPGQLERGPVQRPGR
jgi:simple sugar transport system permease protein